MSYPLTDVSGAELRPAFVVDRLRELFPTLRVEQEDGEKGYRLTAKLPALEAAGQFQKKLKIDILDLELTIGGQDPADAAMAYGWANGALGALWYPLVEGFHIVDGRARVRLDLEAPAVSLRGRASLSLKLGQICRLAVYFGIKALRAVMAARGEQKEQNVRKAA